MLLRDLGCSHGKVRRGPEGGEGGIGLCCATMKGSLAGGSSSESRWSVRKREGKAKRFDRFVREYTSVPVDIHQCSSTLN